MKQLRSPASPSGGPVGRVGFFLRKWERKRRIKGLEKKTR